MSAPPPPADGAPGAGWGPSSYDRDPASRGPAPYGHQDARAQPGITGDFAGAGRYGGSGSHDGGAGPRYGGYGRAAPPPPPSSSYGAPGGYGQQYGQPADRYGAPPGDDRGARRPGPRYQQRDLDNINLARGMDKLRIGKHEAITRTLQSTREDGGQEEIKDYDEEDDPLHSGIEFTDPDLGIPNRVLKGIQAAGLTEASVIQSLTIPYFTAPLTNPSAAVHVIAQARSGSGKSAAFVTGLLSILEDQLQGPQAIILAPTRELVLQTYDWVRSLGRDMGMTTEQLVTLGLPDNGRFLRQRVTAQVVVGTPATVSNALGQAETIQARNVRMLVLDEADQLLYMSRRDQESEQSRGRGGGGRGGGSHSHAPACHKVRDAIERSRPRDAPPCRFALFSATFSPSMLNRVRLFVPRTLKSEMIKLADNEVMVDEIAQLYVDLRELTGGRDIWREDAQRMKEDFVQKLLTKRTQTGKVIIFVQSRHGCQSLATRLSGLENMKTSEFHGGLDPGQRDEYFDLFMMGSTNILVATDVLARGVDISGVSMVINFDMPYEEGGRRGYVGESTEEANATETYVHRVGRTGRFGANGTAVSLIATQQDDGLRVQVEEKYGDRGSGEPIIHRVPSDDVSEIERKAQEVCETVARKRKQRRRAQRLAEEAAMSSAPQPPGAPADAIANNSPQDVAPMLPADPMAPLPPLPTPM